MRKLSIIVNLLCLLIFGFLVTKEAMAVPAAPVEITLTQPDGTTFTARQWGDERMHGWETTDGYTIVLNKTTGYWHYATLDASGRLVPSSEVVGHVLPSESSKYLRPQILQKEGAMESRAALELGQAPSLPIENSKKVVPSTGTARLPVILINFQDTTTTYTYQDFNTLLFGTGNNSMKDYYKEVSYGKFNIDGDTMGWYKAANNHDYYGANVSGVKGEDQWVGDLVYEAVQKADLYTNFSLFDNDGDCYVDVVVIVHQGEGEEASGNSTDIWSHRSSLNDAKARGRSNYGEYTTNDPCSSGGYIKVNDYIIQPEKQGGNQSTVGVFCHEFGHALGLPDLYDTDGSSSGIGDWGLMGTGSWNKVSRPGDRPAHMTAWSKYRLGWVTPTQVKGTLTDEKIEPASQRADVYQLLPGSPSKGGEYFLIENRQKLGFDIGLPGAGLLIWHIEENKTNNKEECYPPNDCETTHYKVALVQADNKWQLEKNNRYEGGNDGYGGDPYPGSSNNTSFNESSTPASTIWDGRITNTGVTNIRQSGTDIYATLYVKPPWARTYGGSSSDAAMSIQQTKDGGYIMAGTTSSFGAGNSDFWVLKLASDGSVEWQKAYGGDYDEVATSIQQTKDGGYIVAGWTSTFGALWEDIWVLKLTSDGSVQWQKTYGGGDVEQGFFIQQTFDGGYILVGSGERQDPDNYGHDIWVLKLAFDGSVEWQKIYGDKAGSSSEYAYSIQQTKDGGYIVAGSIRNPDSDRYDDDGWILKLALDGSVEWQKSYGETGYDSFYSIQQTKDGGYIVLGSVVLGETNTSFGTSYFWVLKLGPDGSVQWQKAYGPARSTYSTNRIQQTSDGGYIVAATTDSFGTGNTDIWVLKLGPDGSVQWQKTYGGSGYDVTNFIQQTSDGGYIVAGWTDTFGLDSDVWVLKLDADGNIVGCSVQGTSNASVENTAVTGIDTSASTTSSDTSITPSDTSVTPSDTNAGISDVCLVQQQYTLTVIKSGTGSGTVTSTNPAGIDCGTDCTQDYLAGTTVTLAASPDANSTFAGWGGDCTYIGNNQAQVTMDADKTCTATFNIKEYTVTPSVGSGQGSISPNTPQTVNNGDTVQFTLTPDQGYHIDSVGGTCGGSLNGNTFTTNPITSDCTVVANFAINQYTVTPSVGSGQGSISPDTPQTVDYDNTVQFTLTPAPGYRIDSVGGTCGGSLIGGGVFTTNPIKSDCTVIANFVKDQYTVTPSVGSGQGSISPNTPQTVNNGDTVQFTLTPAPGYRIDSVEGTCGGSLNGNIYTTNPIQFDCTVVVNFAKDQYTLTVNKTGTGSGSVTSSPSGINCGSDYSETYDPGTLVTLKAVADTGSAFDGWSGDCIDVGNPAEDLAQVTMDADKICMVTFNPDDDNDGVSNETENGATNNGDGNGDGIKDSDQNNVTSFLDESGNNYLTLENPDKYPLVDVETYKPPADAPSNIKFPYGMVGFIVKDVATGGYVTMRIFIPKNTQITGYYKKNMNTGQWDNIATLVEHGPSYAPDKTVITLVILDGGPYDEDGVSNGSVKDLGGPGYVKSSGGGCSFTPYKSNPTMLILIIILLSVLFIKRARLL